jgi:hypothetical protein
MLFIKSKEIKLALLLCMFLAILAPALTQAEEYDTGSIASKRAAEQREAIAKRAAKKRQAVAEKKTA